MQSNNGGKLMDNRSAFNVNQYDENVRRVIPFYDEIYDQIFRLILTYFGGKEISVLDKTVAGLIQKKDLKSA